MRTLRRLCRLPTTGPSDRLCPKRASERDGWHAYAVNAHPTSKQRPVMCVSYSSSRLLSKRIIIVTRHQKSWTFKFDITKIIFTRLPLHFGKKVQCTPPTKIPPSYLANAKNIPHVTLPNEKGTGYSSNRVSTGYSYNGTDYPSKENLLQITLPKLNLHPAYSATPNLHPAYLQN